MATDRSLRRRRRLNPPFASEKQRIGDIAANVRGVVWEAWLTPDGEVQRVDFVSHQLETMLGYSAAEWAAKPNFWLAIVHPDDKERAEREADLIFATGKGGTSRFRWLGKNGREIWVETQSVVTADQSGRPSAMRGVTMDITARIDAEERFRRQETFTHAIANSMAEGVYAADSAGNLTFLNPAGEQMLGWGQGDLAGRSVHDTIHRHGSEGVPYPPEDCPLLQVARSGVALRDHEDLFVRKDGKLVEVICTVAPIVVSGRVTGEVLTFQDISERKRTERRRSTRHKITQIIAESSGLEDSARLILETLGEGVGWDAGALWVADPGGLLRCLDFWAAPELDLHELELATRETTFSIGAGLPGIVWQSGAHRWIGDTGRDRNFWRAHLARKTQLEGAFAAPIRVGSANVGVMEFFSQRVREPDDDLLEMMATLGTQIGLLLERKRVEHEILQRNEELKTLLYVVSHDLKEPLRAIESFSGMLETRHLTALDPAGQDLVRRVVKGASRLRRILEDLLMLSRVRMIGPDKEETAGEFLVREALARLEHRVAELGGSVRIAPDLPRLLVDRTWATQAIYNLITNALKFTRPGEPPEVEITAYDPREFGIPGAGLVVRDRGTGIEPELRERVFELFQRGVGREIEGTGAGLAIVREVALRHGGCTWMQAREGGGSEFVLLFTTGRPHGSSAASADGCGPVPPR